MSEYWRRLEIETELRRGELRGLASGASMRELAPGHVVSSAVFRLEPLPGSPPRQGPPVELHIQVREGVSLLSRWRNARGEWEQLVQRDQIAIAGWGGRSDHRYTWVQIYSESPETINASDGTVRTEDVAYDNETPVVHGSDFDWHGRRWYPDVGDDTSARYAVRGTDLSVGRNGEIIYDSPEAQLTMLPYLRANADVLRVEKTTQFQSFLVEVPVLQGEAAYLPRQPTVAAVAWSRDQTFGRDTVGGAPRLLAQGYRVHFIVPNAVRPPGLTSVMWRVFRGR